jgi:hypothetical protein
MLGAGVTIFAAVIFTVSFIYLSKSGMKQNAASIIYLILACLSAARFALFDDQFISGLNFIFLTALFVYWICLSTGRRLDKELSVYILGDAFKQGLSMPFLNFGRLAAGIKSFSKYNSLRNTLPALLGIIFFLPLMIVVLRLLIQADLAFENFMSAVFDFIRIENIMTYIWEFIIGIPVAFYLYGLIYGDVKGRHTEKVTAASVDLVANFIKIAPKITIYTVLTAFNAIYLIYFAVQAAYFFSAFSGVLPETFTYAEYARRGFFELCTVAGINLGVLTLAHVIMVREPGEEPGRLRVETLLISLFTMLLIATALSKMAIYIGAYGLTQLRVYTSWFMVLLLFIFLIICIRQFAKINMVKIVLTGFVFMFMILSYGNVDGIIANYNINRYEAGAFSEFDIEMLAGLSDAAAPYIYDLYLRTDEGDAATRLRLESSIMKRYPGWNPDRANGFRGFNLQRYRADEIRDEIRTKLAEPPPVINHNPDSVPDSVDRSTEDNFQEYRAVESRKRVPGN